MTSRVRLSLLLVSLGLVIASAACAKETTVPTRVPIPIEAVAATATVKAGGVPGGAAAGGPVSGAQVFQSSGCNACHALGGQGGAVGPKLDGLAATAATRKPGASAEEYVRESIMNPNAVIAPGFNKDLMPATFGQSLSKEQLDALVKYLLEQK